MIGRMNGIISSFLNNNNIFTEQKLLELIEKTYKIINCKSISKEEKDWIIKKIKNNDLISIHYKYSGNVCFYQLYGTQRTPDFIIIDGNKILKCEGKSSKKGQIQFNSHIPESDIIYFISIRNKNCVCLGKDIFPEDKRKHIIYMYNVLNKILNRLWDKYVGNLEYWKPDYLRRMGIFEIKKLKQNRRVLINNVKQFIESV